MSNKHVDQAPELDDVSTFPQQIKADSRSTISKVTQVAGNYYEHHHHYPTVEFKTASPNNLPSKAYHQLIGRSQEQKQLLNALHLMANASLLLWG